jgi:hypothetical protein
VSSSSAENRIIDPSEWIRRQQERLRIAAAAQNNQRELAVARDHQAKAETSRLSIAFAPISDYIHQLSSLGVQVGIDRPGVLTKPLSPPPPLCTDYQVRLEEVTYRGLPDEHSTTWGFGVRATRNGNDRIEFEYYDFEPAIGLIVRLTSFTADEVLERFLYQLSKVTVAVNEIGL